MTMFEQLAEAFPLHLQRIVELSVTDPHDIESCESATVALARSFTWQRTPEGHEYWSRLAGWM